MRSQAKQIEGYLLTKPFTSFAQVARDMGLPEAWGRQAVQQAAKRLGIPVPTRAVAYITCAYDGVVKEIEPRKVGKQKFCDRKCAGLYRFYGPLKS